MAKKDSKEAAVRAVTCSKCNAKTMTNPGSRHRRCPGIKDAPPRKLGELLAPGERGIWE